MNAARLFVDELARIGARLTCDGDRLKLVPPADRALSPELIARGRELKPALIELLRTETEQHQRDEFEERAALCEHDGGLPASQAELMAVACTVPLRRGESVEQRDATIIHFAEHLDRLRKTRGASNAC